MERIRFVIDKKTNVQMDEQIDKWENIYLFSLQEVGYLKQISIYESIFEETSLLEYPGHTKYVEGYIVFNFPTIRPSAYLSLSTYVCASTFSWHFLIVAFSSYSLLIF